MIRFKIHIIPGILFIILTGISCGSDSTQLPAAQHNEYSLDKQGEVKDKAAMIKFLDKTSYNFELIEAGDTVVHKFFFTNIGKQPLIIRSATATCGCTIAYFNKQPIIAGKRDSIVATFISNKKNLGYQNKVVTVDCNSPQSPFLLTLYGKVK